VEWSVKERKEDISSENIVRLNFMAYLGADMLSYNCGGPMPFGRSTAVGKEARDLQCFVSLLLVLFVFGQVPKAQTRISEA